eukprot:g11571.t1
MIGTTDGAPEGKTALSRGQCERGGSQQWRRSWQRGCGERIGSQRQRSGQWCGERGGSEHRPSGQRGCGERGGSGGVQGDGAVSAEAASTGLQIEDTPPAALAASSSSSSQAATGSPHQDQNTLADVIEVECGVLEFMDANPRQGTEHKIPADSQETIRGILDELEIPIEQQVQYV